MIQNEYNNDLLKENISIFLYGDKKHKVYN